MVSTINIAGIEIKRDRRFIEIDSGYLICRAHEVKRTFHQSILRNKHIRASALRYLEKHFINMFMVHRQSLLNQYDSLCFLQTELTRLAKWLVSMFIITITRSFRLTPQETHKHFQVIASTLTLLSTLV